MPCRLRQGHSSKQPEGSRHDGLIFASRTGPILASASVEEAIAEKIRAASQRSKIRDLYDLAEFASRPLNRHLIRSLAVLKLWNSGGPGLDYEQFKQRIEERTDYDVGELRNLLRRDHRPDVDKMIGQIVEGFRFLEELTDLEKAVAADNSHRRRADAELLIANAIQPQPSRPGPTFHF